MAKIRRYDEIMAGATANMIAKQDKITDFNEGSIIHTILDTVSRIAERMYVAIRQGYNELLVLIPYSLFGFERKNGFHASGKVIFKRSVALSAQSIVPKGTRVSGGGYSFTTTEAAIIPVGGTESAAVEVVADKAGRAFVAAGVINTIDSVVPADVVEVTNPYVLSGGTDQETDAEYKERFRIYINGLSGTNSYAIKSAALSVNAVRSVSTQNHKPPYKNLYNMSIYVDDGSGGATEETIEAVRRAIEGDDTEANPGHLAPGINIRVLSPTAIPVVIEMDASIYSIDTDEAREGIRSVVSSYINGLTIGKPVVLSQIIMKVMALNYVKDVSIFSPQVNVTPAINQIARTGTIKINLTEAD
nr:baseplate J/gp47 family protein [uncultured Treponema sp.]